MIVYFENSLGVRRQIGNADSSSEVMRIIHNFLEERTYKSYYTRSWVENNETIYDVGSHSEFFIVDGLI